MARTASSFTRGPEVGQTEVPVIYGRDGDDYVIVASRWARRSTRMVPELVAHPDVKIQGAGQGPPVRARTGRPDKKRVWPTMNGAVAQYDKYQADQARHSVVLLGPAEDKDPQTGYPPITAYPACRLP